MPELVRPVHYFSERTDENPNTEAQRKEKPKEQSKKEVMGSHPGGVKRNGSKMCGRKRAAKALPKAQLSLEPESVASRGCWVVSRSFRLWESRTRTSRRCEQ